MKKIISAIALCIFSAGPSYANLVSNGSFSSGGTDWSSPSGSVAPQLTFTGGVATLDATINNYPEVSIAQNISGFVAGTSYLLSFDATGSGTVFLYDVDYDLCLTINPYSCSAQQVFGTGSYSFQFTRASIPYDSSHLVFKTKGFATIDNVTISAVPEPETYAMMLAGLGALGLMASRRQTARRLRNETLAPSSTA